MRWAKRKVVEHGYLVENVGISQSGIDTRLREGGLACSRGVALRGRSGHDGVRDPRRSARGHRNPGDYGLPPQARATLERHRGWNQRVIGRLLSRSGPATVEFAVIAVGFLAVTVALMALWRVLGDGLLVQHALAVASHHIQAVAPVTIVDVFLY